MLHHSEERMGCVAEARGLGCASCIANDTPRSVFLHEVVYFLKPAIHRVTFCPVSLARPQRAPVYFTSALGSPSTCTVLISVANSPCVYGYLLDEFRQALFVHRSPTHNFSELHATHEAKRTARSSVSVIHVRRSNRATGYSPNTSATGNIWRSPTV
jgi:hypothetical protein